MRMLVRIVSGMVALAGAVMACIYGYELTGWALVRAGGPTSLDYGLFGLVNVAVAIAGASPGLLIGLPLRRLPPRQ